ncbi:MAG: hypothetical protein WC683_08010 [bacterium]
MARAWCLCAVCHRVLYLEDGPVCEDCRTKQEAAGKEDKEPEPTAA